MKRRRFCALSALGAVGALGAGAVRSSAQLPEERHDHDAGGRDFSPASGKEREVIPSACWQCVSRCGILGFVENGRLKKIEGQPESLATRGRICARGQAGVNQVYDPDRLLHPLKRVGDRGEGKWQQVSWDEALDLLIEGGEIAGRAVKGLRALRDEGTPEKFLFHYGRVVGSDSTILFDHFLPAYGTASVGDHHSICMAAGGIASILTGGSAGSANFEKASYILNFGCNLLEASIPHVNSSQRWMDALNRGAKLITFDVRLSNTAARSTEWVPVKPGTDLAVILAMCHVMIANGVHDENAVEKYTNVTVEELEDHLEEYTPEWAERISGVPAAKIESIALEYAHAQSARCFGLRGLFMHHNGVQARRATIMLDAIAGHIDARSASGYWPRWDAPFETPTSEAKALNIFTGEEGAYAFPYYNASHQIAHMIDKGPERPDLYMVYCHNPVYSNGDCDFNARVYKDEEKIPFLVAVDVTLSETSQLADLVLPDATYLERWTLEGTAGAEMVPEYYIRQPMHVPLGEARNFIDVACDIARRLDFDLGFGSAEEYVRATCDNTAGVKEAGGFDYMRKHGIWLDRSTKAVYKERNGKLQIRSDDLVGAGFSGIPSWMPVPEHESMREDELILTTFKVAVQTHSRTQNCKWLTELYHDNPAWINTATAARLGIKDGDRIAVRSEIGEIVTTARVTSGVHPSAIAMSTHAGHWEYGTYASGHPGRESSNDPDLPYKWWRSNGEHPNLVIPNRGDPIAGSMCWNDTVVRVEKV